MPAVGVFAVVDQDAGVQEGAAEGPEEGGEAAGLWWLGVSQRVLSLGVGGSVSWKGGRTGRRS